MRIITPQNKTIFLIAICCLYSSMTFAQIGFDADIIISSNTDTRNIQAVFSADIDQDGDMDLLSASEDDNKIAWYKNLDGEGSFGTQQIIDDNAPRASSVYAVDIDGDGDLDVFTAEKNNERIAWVENIDGQGTFGESQQIAQGLGNFLNNVVAGDVDGDGDIDVAYSGQNILAWNENLDGLGTFGPVQFITTQNTIALSLVDLNNDNNLDMLYASSLGILWRENTDGQGAFGDFQLISNEVDNPNDVTAADIDGDGDLDVISSSEDDGKIAVYENLGGQGIFGPQQVLSSLDEALAVDVVDIDGDGDLDVYSVSYDPSGGFSRFYIHENLDGLGNFGVAQQIAFVASGRSKLILFSDLDGDTDLELITNDQFYTGSYYFDDIIWFENLDGLGDFGGLGAEQQTIGSIYFPGEGFPADLDNDGDVDILVASRIEDDLVWFENINGDYSGPRIIFDNLNAVTSVAATDIDGDNDLDIIFNWSPGGSNNGSIGWCENLDGMANFGLRQDVITGLFAFPESVRGVDMDGDGDMDVLSNNRWYENTDGLGSFVSGQGIGGIVADMDNDGDLDVAGFNSGIRMYKNLDGMGDYQFHQVIDNDNSYTARDFADIDGDGDNDILSSSSFNDNVVWYENLDGQGTFGPRQVIMDLDEVILSKLVDVDSDGDLDLVTAQTGASTGGLTALTWWPNIDGQGTYGVQQFIAEYTFSQISAFDFDFDNDGDFDFLSTSSFSGGNVRVAWYENLGITGNRIAGQVRLDIGLNGCSSSDWAVPNLLVATEYGTETIANFTNSSGSYRNEIDFEGTATTTVVEGQISSTYFDITPASVETQFVGVGNEEIVDFCVEPIVVANDLYITLIPIGQPIGGTDTSYQLIYENIGTTTQNATVEFQFDNTRQNFVSAVPVEDNVTGDIVTWTFNNIGPLESGIIDITLNTLPAPVNEIGDLIFSEGRMAGDEGDESPVNNVSNVTQMVIGTTDPINIMAVQGPEIFMDEVGEYLDFVVQFQNLGNSPVNRLVIQDLLSGNLNWSSLRLLSSSHSFGAQVIDESELIFTFEGINLPPASLNEEESKGFVAFQIKTQDDLTVGDVIENKALIFIDTEAPIETNLAVVTVVEGLGVEDPHMLQSIQLYPNPANDVLMIYSPSQIEIRQVAVSTILGERLITSSEKEIGVSSLSSGVYFVEITTDQGVISKRIIKN